MERRQRCPATSPYQNPTKTSMIPDTFRVLPPLSPEIPGPPPAPKPFRVAPLTVKRRDESAFVIIADSMERKSRDPSPDSGRVSPFRGHGFKESSSHHASREPSPMRQEPISRMPPKSHLSRSRSKLPVASPGYVSGRNSTSTSPNRNQTTSIPRPVSRRGSLSPSRAVQILNQTNTYKTATLPRHVKTKIPQKQSINDGKSPLHNSKNVQSPKRVGAVHSKTNSNFIATKPPLPKATQQKSRVADGRKTPQQPSSPKKQLLITKNSGITARSPSRIPRERYASIESRYNRSSSVSPSRKETDSKLSLSKPKPRPGRSPGPGIHSRTKDNFSRLPVGHKKDTESKGATSQSQDTSADLSIINLSGKPRVPIERFFKREEEEDSKELDKTQKEIKESPVSSEKYKSSVSSKPTSSNKSTEGRSPEKEKTSDNAKSRNNSGESRIRNGDDNKISSRPTEMKPTVSSAKSRTKEFREEPGSTSNTPQQKSDEAVKEPQTPSSDDSKSSRYKAVESDKKGDDDDEPILEPSVTLVRTTTAPALELAQPDVMPFIGPSATPSDSQWKTEDGKQMDKEKKREEGQETDSLTSAKGQNRLRERKKGDNNNAEEAKQTEERAKREEGKKTDSVRDSAKSERTAETVDTTKSAAKGVNEKSDKSKTDKESVVSKSESDAVSSKGLSVDSVRSTSSVETVRAVARVKATVKKQDHDDVKGNIKEEPDVEVLSANNLLKSDNNNSATRNVAWQQQSPELRQMNNSVHPAEPPMTPVHQQHHPRPVQPAKPKGCCGKFVDKLKCSSCCRKQPKPANQTAGSDNEKGSCCRLSPCCSETGCLTNLCRKLNCCKKCSCCKRRDGVAKQKPKRPGKSRSKFKDCLSKLNCFSRCCKSRHGADDGDESGPEDEPQPGCCARCKKRTKSCWRALFCLNRTCCQKLRQCTRCNRLACCRSGGCCGTDPPELNRRKSRFSLKKSQSIVQGPPKLDPTLVDHSSIMRGAIPVLPLPLAWLCLIFNVFLPGLGTLSSGIFCLCFGKPRFSINDSHATRFGSFCVNVVVAISQLFTILFCLVGWGWSIWWGVIMIRLARKHRRILLAEKNAEQPVPVAVNQNHDAERGR